MDVGYGKGIYPKHKVPSIPRHPHCMCMLEDVFAWERKGKKIKPEGARRYIDSLDEKRKRALFGDAGLQAYEKGGDWQKLLRGWDGFLKPKSRLSAGDFKFDLQSAGDDSIIKTHIDGIGDANIPMAKLTRYALNPDKDINKARAFKRALGYDLSNVDDLIENVQRHINDVKPVKKPGRGYGDLLEIAMELRGPNGKTASVLTGWIIDKNNGEVRMTTIHVDRRKKGSDVNGRERI